MVVRRLAEKKKVAGVPRVLVRTLALYAVVLGSRTNRSAVAEERDGSCGSWGVRWRRRGLQMPIVRGCCVRGWRQ